MIVSTKLTFILAQIVQMEKRTQSKDHYLRFNKVHTTFYITEQDFVIKFYFNINVKQFNLIYLFILGVCVGM